MKIDVLTLFPEMFAAVTESSILGRAAGKGIIEVNPVNIRDYSNDKHKKADDTPFGGGPGMVMMADPIFRALEAAGAENKKIIYMSPRGRLLDMDKITELSGLSDLVIMCGHYEGVDQRVIDRWNMEEISIGDYILTGGELPAMVLIDAVARFLPDVLGNSACAEDESVYSGLLECDQYTKPRAYRNMEVPEILTGGNHKMIRLWQYRNSLELTRKRRPDMWEAYLAKEKNLTKDEKKILDEVVSKPL